MRVLISDARPMLCAVWLLGCGGIAILDDAGAGGGDPNTCEGQPCGTPCEITPGQGDTGVCTTEGDCAYDTTCVEGPCDTGLVCASCVTCNEIECLEGFCAADRSCEPAGVSACFP